MPEYDFEDLYDQIRDAISVYMDPENALGI